MGNEVFQNFAAVILRTIGTNLKSAPDDTLADLTQVRAEKTLASALRHTAVAGQILRFDLVAMIQFSPFRGDKFQQFRVVPLRGALSVAPGTHQSARGDLDL